VGDRDFGRRVYNGFHVNPYILQEAPNARDTGDFYDDLCFDFHRYGGGASGNRRASHDVGVFGVLLSYCVLGHGRAFARQQVHDVFCFGDTFDCLLWELGRKRNNRS